MEVTDFKLKCKRCNHEWIPRTPEPKYCPYCKSPSWNKDKKNAKRKSA